MNIKSFLLSTSKEFYPLIIWLLIEIRFNTEMIIQNFNTKENLVIQGFYWNYKDTDITKGLLETVLRKRLLGNKGHLEKLSKYKPLYIKKWVVRGYSKIQVIVPYNKINQVI